MDDAAGTVAALASEAGELYALHPSDFTAARNARAAALRADDRALSDAVRLLPRLSPPAWVAGLLVRRRRADVDAALALGTELRDAQQQLDRAALTRLTADRRRVVAALVQAGAALAADEGHPVSTAVLDDVAETLQAALTDPAAGDALLTGRLLRSLESVGFDAVDLSDAVAASGAPGAIAASGPRRRRTLHAVDDPHDDHLRRLVREAEGTAAQAAESAAEALASAEARVSDLEARRRGLGVELQDLEDEIVHTRRALASADREAREVGRARDAAQRTADRAAEVLERARERRTRLDGD